LAARALETTPKKIISASAIRTSAQSLKCSSSISAGEKFEPRDRSITPQQLLYTNSKS
jgi:hypothetical protein